MALFGATFLLACGGFYAAARQNSDWVYGVLVLVFLFIGGRLLMNAFRTE